MILNSVGDGDPVSGPIARLDGTGASPEPVSAAPSRFVTPKDLFDVMRSTLRCPTMRGVQALTGTARATGS